MYAKLTRLLNIEKDEQTVVSLLLLQSVFLGIFAGAFDIGAHSLFLEAFDASLIPRAFVISGLAGIVITSFYTRLQRSLKFSVFAIINLSLVAIITFLLRLGFTLSYSKVLIFTIFVLMGPLTIISFLGFWGNVSRIFTLRQGKRLFGIIDTGQIVGIIMSSYAIPVLMSLKFAIRDTLLICSTSIFIALLIQLFISRKADFTEKSKQKKELKTNETGFFKLFSSRYTLLITLFVIFSVITAFFVHYSFITVAQENYPEPGNLASFLGAFMGTLTVFTVIVKTFLYGKIMKMYGLRLALMLTPVLIGIFTIIALFVGGLYGYSIGTAGFTLFFLLLAMSKLFVKSLKDSIEVPSSKILYQSLEPEIKYDVQAQIDGTINEVAAFFSGLFLAGLGLITAINLLHYSIVLVFVLFCWLLSGALLYKAYRGSLYEALKRFRESGKEHEVLSSGTPDKYALQGKKLFYSLRLLPQLWNGFFTEKIPSLLNNDKNDIKTETITLIKRLGITKEELEQSLDASQKDLIPSVYGINHFNSENPATDIRVLINSPDAVLRKKAIFMISVSDDRKLHTRLIPLFRDYDPEVRASAIRAAGFTANKDLMHYLAEMLEDEYLYPVAFHALTKAGKHALDALENAFLRIDFTDKGLRRITETIARINSPEKISFLFNKLDHSNKAVINEALTGLIETAYRPSGKEMNKYISSLRKIVEIAARNFALVVSLRTYLPASEVRNAMEEEFKDNIDLIFNFLSIAYDPQSIYHIRQNYESGTTEGIGFAIELLDLFIDDTINPFLFPLFEDSSDQEKINNLQAEYPVEIQKVPEVLLSIINSSKYQIGYYARISALNELNELNEYPFTNDVIAQAFHPFPAIKEAAFFIIKNRKPELLPELEKRISKLSDDYNIKLSFREINHSVERIEWQKIYYLKNSITFSFLNRTLLPVLAENFELSCLSSFSKREISEMFGKDEMIFLCKGEIFFHNEKDKTIVVKEDEILFISEIKKALGENVFVDNNEDLVVMRIKENNLRELLFDYENEFADPFINKLTESHEEILSLQNLQSFI